MGSPNNVESSSKNSVSFVFSGNPVLNLQKLDGENYLNWSVGVKMWFLGQKLSAHHTKKLEDIAKELCDEWESSDN